MRYFKINFVDSKGKEVELHIDRDGNAEAIIRGLIHSGIEIIIREIVIPEEGKANVPDREAVRSTPPLSY